MSVKEKSLLGKFDTIDKRFLLWTTVILMVVTSLHPLGLPVPITDNVKKFYDGLNSLPSGAVVLVSQDCDPTRFAEYGGGLIALFKQLSTRPLKVIIFTVADPACVPVTERYFIPILKDAKKVYGVDYVDIGYIPGDEAAVVRTASDLKSIINKDYYGNDIASLELLKNIDGAQDIKDTGGAIFVTGNGSFYYTRQDWTVKYHVTCFCINGVTDLGPLTPFINEGLITYIIAGLPQCAAYETVIGSLGLSSGAVEALTIAVLLLFVAIVLGNISYLSKRRRQ
jgi:hypothetical protein